MSLPDLNSGYLSAGLLRCPLTPFLFQGRLFLNQHDPVLIGGSKERRNEIQEEENCHNDNKAVHESIVFDEQRYAAVTENVLYCRISFFS